MSSMLSGRWADAAVWSGDGLRREVLFFPSQGVELYASLYAATPITRPYGVVACNSWGVEADRCDPLQRSVALAMAKLGGVGLVFHYPGYGDSHGELAGLDLDDLAIAAADALAEAARRCPDLSWILAGFVLGASVACLAQRRSAAQQLLLVQPALQPGAYFHRLARTRRPLAPGPGQAREMVQAGGVPGMAYGYPVPGAIADRPEEADAMVQSAIGDFSGPGAIVSQAGMEPLPDALPQLERVPVEGTWRFGSQDHPQLAAAAAEWLDRGTRPQPRSPTAPNLASIEAQLSHFIATELLDERYDGRDPLAAGLVDSIGIEQIVSYLEDEFGLTFHDEEMIEENFESIANLIGLIATKLGEARP